MFNGSFKYIISCGYKYQSKTKDPIYLPHGCRMVWSYFGSGHGKGVHDEVGAILKQEIQKEQLIMNSQRFHCVVDAIDFCKRK